MNVLCNWSGFINPSRKLPMTNEMAARFQNSGLEKCEFNGSHREKSVRHEAATRTDLRFLPCFPADDKKFFPADDKKFFPADDRKVPLDQFTAHDCNRLGLVLGDWSAALQEVAWTQNDAEPLAAVPAPYASDDGKAATASSAFASGRQNMSNWGYTADNSLLYHKGKESLPPFCHAVSAAVLSHRPLRLSDPLLKLHMQRPGHTIPLHVDTYNEYMFARSVPSALAHRIRRYLIFLEEGDVGHFFQVKPNLFNDVNVNDVNDVSFGQVGKTVLHGWPRGLVIDWPQGKPHLAVNAGVAPKFTLQITGLKSSDESNILRSSL